MKREQLFVKCNDLYEYVDLMVFVENLDIKWSSGDKPTHWDLYATNKLNTQASVIININLKLKNMSFAFDYLVPQYEYIFSVVDVKNDLGQYLKNANKKPFEELNCSDFEHCYECPLQNYDYVCHAMMSGGKFVDVLERIGKDYMKAKEEYEKGDK